MLTVNIHDAKTNLSKYLEKVEKGETVTICRHNVPIAEIKPIQKKLTKPRPSGLCAGEFTIPDSFYDPLPDDIMKYFNGEGED